MKFFKNLIEKLHNLNKNLKSIDSQLSKLESKSSSQLKEINNSLFNIAKELEYKR